MLGRKDHGRLGLCYTQCERDTKYTMEDPYVAYILGLPNDSMVVHILSLLLLACDPLLMAISNDVSPTCDRRGLNGQWRWLISSTPNFFPLHVVKHHLRCLRSHRYIGCFENKLFSNTIVVFILSRNELFVLFTRPCTCWLHLFLNRSTKELVQFKACSNEVSYDDLDPCAHEDVRIYFPPKTLTS